jgi:hypothetical protein
MEISMGVEDDESYRRTDHIRPLTIPVSGLSTATFRNTQIHSTASSDTGVLKESHSMNSSNQKVNVQPNRRPVSSGGDRSASVEPTIAGLSLFSYGDSSSMTGRGSIPKAVPPKPTGIIYDVRMFHHFPLHEEDEDHPENQHRIRVIFEALMEAGLVARCLRLPARLATRDELLLFHTPSHLNLMAEVEGTRCQMVAIGASWNVNAEPCSLIRVHGGSIDRNGQTV